MGAAYDPGVSQAPPSEDYGLGRAGGWQLKLCWTPKRCFLSGQPLWGKRAYHGIREITGPGESIFDEYWIQRDEFLIWKLTR